MDTASQNDLLFDTKQPYGLREEMARQIESALENQDSAQVLSYFSYLHVADIASFIATTDESYRQDALALLASQFDPEILAYLDRSIRVQVIELIGINKASMLVTQLDPDDVMYVIEDLPEEFKEALIELLPLQTQQEVAELLAYPENSAGRLMQKQLVAIPEYWTVGQTIDYVRQNHGLPSDFYEVIVVDAKHRPVGGVLVSRIMRSQRGVLLSTLMEQTQRIIPTNLDQEEVSYIFTQYGLSSAPVVNRDGRLVGVISLQDVVEVIEEEAEEDILRLGGISQTDIHTNVVRTACHRFSWLVVNLGTALLASHVIGLFGDSIGKMVILASLMPIVASMGGNTGTQSLTVVTRALATKEITSLNAMRVVIKEMLVGAMNGTLFGVLSIPIIWFVTDQLGLALVFSAALCLNLAVAGFCGSCVPLILDRFKIDPATTSSVFVTAVTDVVGFFAFLGLATLLLL